MCLVRRESEDRGGQKHETNERQEEGKSRSLGQVPCSALGKTQRGDGELRGETAGKVSWDGSPG